MQQKSILFQGANVVYSVSGKGPVLILLHGFAEDGSVWDTLIPALSENNTVIVPDLPGTASSQLLDSRQGMEDYAEVIKQICDAENIEICTLIGHSMGGYITLAFAEKYPAILNAFGLFHSSAYADDEEKKETRNKAIRVINEKGPMPFLKTMIPGLFYNAEASNKLIEQQLEKAKRFSAAALVQYYEAMINRPDRTRVLKNFEKPVLFILGEHDKAVPYELGLQQTHLAAHTYVHVLRQSGHMGILEEPELAIAYLTNFLTGLRDN